MATVKLILDVKTAAYIAANPGKVLDLDEPIWRDDGYVAFGDGVTPLSGLVFKPVFTGASSLAATLAVGNSTGGNSILVTPGDIIDTTAGGGILRIGTTYSNDIIIGSAISTATLSLVATTTLIGVMVASGTLSMTNASPFSMTRGQVVTVAMTGQTVGAATLTVPDFAGVSDEFTFKTKSQTISNKTFSTGTNVLLGSDATGDLYYNGGSGALTRLAAGAAGTFLRFAGTGVAPVVSTLVLPNAATATRIVFATGTNTYGESPNFTYNGVLFTVGGVALNTSLSGSIIGQTSGRFTVCCAGDECVILNLAANTALAYFKLTTSYINSKLFISGTTIPTALIHIGTGLATANNSPLKFTTSGTGIVGLLTTPEKGSMEFSDYGLWFTKVAANREKVWCGLIAQTAPTTNNIGVVIDYFGSSATRVLTTPNTWISITGDDGNVYKIPGYS